MFSLLQTQKRERIKYSKKQLKELEVAFAVNQYPSAAERDQLAAKIGVTESKIQVQWVLYKLKDILEVTNIRDSPEKKEEV